MLIETKVKVARIIDGKTRKRTETYLTDKELFAEAEYTVTEALSHEQVDGYVDEFEIQSLKISGIKEVATQFNGSDSYIATLKDIWLDNDNNEKTLKYKILLWADSPSDALHNVMQLAKQGYDMQVEGIKQADYEYFTDITKQVQEAENEEQDTEL